tara:strand:+ start:1415 stop:1852 length:438 start_codon:yes stop_codon:yes gene_type:complete
MLSVSHIKIIAIGKIKRKWIQEGIEMYLKRLPGLNVIEIKDSTLTKEEYALKGLLKKNESLITLDEKGQSFTSQEFSQKLLNFQNQKIVFAIGGANGFSPTLNRSASWKLSLSPLTFPHEIARLLFIEQIYRAKMITQDSPYHKE